MENFISTSHASSALPTLRKPHAKIRSILNDDGQPAIWMRNKAAAEYVAAILDARYQRPIGTVLRGYALLMAVGVDAFGRADVLAIEKTRSENTANWKLLLSRLRERSLRNVEFVVSDHHAGLRKAIQDKLPGTVWQRSCSHFIRNAAGYLPRKADTNCLASLSCIYDHGSFAEARSALATWLRVWRQHHPKLCIWVEQNIGETLNFYNLPKTYRAGLKSTSLIDQLVYDLTHRSSRSPLSLTDRDASHPRLALVGEAS